MRFLVDECAGPAVAEWLITDGHDVFSVYDESPGLDDDTILAKAYAENRILITIDKDFGEKVFREQLPHRGIVLMRLQDQSAAVKIETLRRLLVDYAHKLVDRFVVVTETAVRFAREEDSA